MAPCDSVVCFPYVGDSIGGSHLSSLLLVRGLARSSFAPLVVVHVTGPLTDELDRLDIPWIPAPGAATFSRSARAWQLFDGLRSVPRLVRMLRELDVSIVHTNDARMHRVWGPSAKLAGCGHVWHQRNAGVSWKVAQAARFADRIVTVSDFARSCLPAYLKCRTTVIDNPFETDGPPPDRARARKSLASELGVETSTPLVAYAASMVPRKRPSVFVQMAAALIANGSDAIFPMFGSADDGPGHETRDRIRTLGLERQIPLMGFRTPIDDILAGCDVLVAPSVKEPFARTVIESMIAGTPVVAAHDGGNVEIIESGRNGVLVTPDDPQGFAVAVTALLDDPGEARVIARRARADVLRRFSVERHVDSMAAAYSSVGAAEQP